jgi:uncharacterized phage protein (TIGR01671 family)
MREIRFRAWDKENKKIVLPDNTKYEAYYNFEGWNVSDVFAINSLLKSEGYDYQQFTGLHDKNGKEIYEGDICQATRDDKFKFKPFVIEIPAFYQADYAPLEVIGNIYENPELLTPSK